MVVMPDNQPVTLNESQVKELIEDSTAILRDDLTEALASLQSLQVTNWRALTGWENPEIGPSLQQVKERAETISEGVAVNAHMKQGHGVRVNRVFSDPISYTRLPGVGGEPAGRGKRDFSKIISDLENQEQFFGSGARHARESAFYTSGLSLTSVQGTKVEKIPLSYVTDYYCDPNNRTRIWAYRLQWEAWNDANRRYEEKVEWVFTDTYKSRRTKTIQYGNKNEPVSQVRVLVDKWVNKLDGWTVGLPDANAAVEVAKDYGSFITDGRNMTRSMTRLWAKVAPVSTRQANNAAAKIAKMTGAGNTAVTDASITPLSTAGKGFDFSSGIGLLAVMATSLEMSVVILSSSPGDAGSSYGAGNLLSLPERLATEARRRVHEEIDYRVLRALGAPDDIEVHFPTLIDAAELLRKAQAASVPINMGLVDGDHAQDLIGDALGVEKARLGDLPDGYMIANNTNFLQSTTADADTDTPADTSGDSNAQGTSGSQPGAINGNAPQTGQGIDSGDIANT